MWRPKRDILWKVLATMPLEDSGESHALEIITTLTSFQTTYFPILTLSKLERLQILMLMLRLCWKVSKTNINMTISTINNSNSSSLSGCTEAWLRPS